MKIEQCSWQQNKGWESGKQPGTLKDAQLVLFFTSNDIIKNSPVIQDLKKFYPKAEIVGGTNMGQILGQIVTEQAVVLTAIQFEHSNVKVISGALKDIKESEELGASLMSKLPQEGLRHVFLLGDGLNLAGTALVKGLSSQVKAEAIFTGGFVPLHHEMFHNEILPSGSIILVAFYGDHLQFTSAASTGWKSYGPIRKVTKSIGETLYELDGKPALDLYREFLGPYANELPEIGLNFPMSVWKPEYDPSTALARTVIGIDEKEKSLRCAGDIPDGYNVQFMITNTDMLVEGAAIAAKETREGMKNSEPELALLMTCISRKMVMKQRIEEELEAVADILGKKVAYIGFYTWGEISPSHPKEKSVFHNQVMSITAIREVSN